MNALQSPPLNAMLWNALWKQVTVPGVMTASCCIACCRLNCPVLCQLPEPSGVITLCILCAFHAVPATAARYGSLALTE